MGKASKWIRNFLIGKKEEKHKQIDAPSSNRGSEMESPKVKRKWSFRRITGKVAVHKFSSSFDSTHSAKMHIQAMVETPASHSFPTTLAEVSKHIENTAATKIQANFRSYLGRKALHALRGLVKVQALVRGHLVRKQTTATLRGMHALMAIQVRARIHRIQMAEANLLGKQPPQHREMPQDKRPIRKNKESKDISLREMLQVFKSRSGPLDRSPSKNIEHDSLTLCSKRPHPYKENTLIAAPNSPEKYAAMSELNPTKALSISLRHPYQQSWEPNYMTKTESSRAKARSESEPKQRPKRGTGHNNKPIQSAKELIALYDGRRQYMSSNSTRFSHGSLDYWAINL